MNKNNRLKEQDSMWEAFVASEKVLSESSATWRGEDIPPVPQLHDWDISTGPSQVSDISALSRDIGHDRIQEMVERYLDWMRRGLTPQQIKREVFRTGFGYGRDFIKKHINTQEDYDNLIQIIHQESEWDDMQDD